MVSFWPFKGDEMSSASFEKVLSQLSSKVNKASARNDSFRQHQRRYKVLWTLYSSFAYILIAAILTLVTGWRSWNAAEYTAVAGGPFLIYGIRTSLDAYYNYRIANAQTHLNDLFKQREAAIEKLKAATKYNSTQQLLDKYGGSPKQSPSGITKRKAPSEQSKLSTPQGMRTGMPPPPTANIQTSGRQQQSPVSPQQKTPMSVNEAWPAYSSQQGGPSQSEEFAPNAFSIPPPPAQHSIAPQYATEGPKWYDRILDIVLGEDESQPKNRLALICQVCRLVNGQAPPGATTSEDIGKWRCSSCGTLNGIESETGKILQISEQAGSGGESASHMSASSPMSPARPVAASTVKTNENDEDEGEDDQDEIAWGTEDEAKDTGRGAASADTPLAASTRSKARQRKKV